MKTIKLLLLMFVVLSVTGCTMNLRDQPRKATFQTSEFFADGRSARPLVENTVARGHLDTDTHFYTGQLETGEFADTFPMEITREVLERGQERYTVFCSPCHGIVGNGQGMIVQRGLKQPNSFHDETVAEQPVGYYFNAITNGFGQMYSYASRVPPEDRWAIVAYIRALQLSQDPESEM